MSNFAASARCALLGFGLAMVALAGCAREAPPPTAAANGPPPLAVERGSAQTGLATYYADSLAGNKTASGERYDPRELTAAHRSLPFGTIVEVKRSDGRTVRVRINDRGPFGKKKRIIDLSRRAAEELGIIRDGVVRVTVTVVGR